MIRHCLAVALLLSIATGVSISGQADPSADFRKRLDAARQQLDADFDGAMEALDGLATESIAIRKQRVLTEAERGLHRDLFLLRGRAYLQLLDNDKVAENFRELLRIDPFFSGGDLAPREREIIVTIKQGEGGVLEVESDQPGAKIFVGGIPAGVTGKGPVKFELLPGDYEIRVEKDGYQPATANAAISMGGTITLRNLTPQLRVPPIAFVTDREDIEVLAEGQSIGRTVRLTALRGQLPGPEAIALDQYSAKAPFTATAGVLFRSAVLDRPLTIRFKRDCFVEELRTLTITTDMLSRLDKDQPMIWIPEVSAVRMKSDTGTLRITSTPSEADVVIDDQLIGRTPLEREVCTGQRRIRVRHRIGSFSATVTVGSGRTESISAVLKPNIAVLGVVDSAAQGKPVPELAASLRRAVGAAVTGYGLSTGRELAPEVQGWTDSSTTELVQAYDRGDQNAVAKLLRLANETFDAPLLVAAARRPAGEGGEAPVDLLVFWSDHAGGDSIRWEPSKQPDPAVLLARLDTPADVSELVYQNEVEGIEVADTALADAPLMIVAVADRSNAASAGIRVGDAIAAVDGSPANGTQFAERVSRKKPGETVNLSVRRAASPARQVPLPVQRLPRRAPVFDRSLFGNAMFAKLTIASSTAPSETERALYNFNLALIRMRYAEWRPALDLLTGVGGLPKGIGVGPGAALFFRARCHEELGEPDRALALYRDASAVTDEIMTTDGATVAELAKRRIAVLSKPAP